MSEKEGPNFSPEIQKAIDEQNARKEQEKRREEGAALAKKLPGHLDRLRKVITLNEQGDDFYYINPDLERIGLDDFNKIIEAGINELDGKKISDLRNEYNELRRRGLEMQIDQILEDTSRFLDADASDVMVNQWIFEQTQNLFETIKYSQESGITFDKGKRQAINEYIAKMEEKTEEVLNRAKSPEEKDDTRSLGLAMDYRKKVTEVSEKIKKILE